MPIDFTLTAAQLRLRAVAREFANDILAPVVRAADEDPDPQSAFVRVKGAYVEAYKLGFATGFIPKRYGGGGASNLDLQGSARRSARSIPASPRSCWSTASR